MKSSARVEAGSIAAYKPMSAKTTAPSPTTESS